MAVARPKAGRPVAELFEAGLSSGTLDADGAALALDDDSLRFDLQPGDTKIAAQSNVQLVNRFSRGDNRKNTAAA